MGTGQCSGKIATFNVGNWGSNPLHEKVLPPVGVLRQDPLTLSAYQCKLLWIKASAKCINKAPLMVKMSKEMIARKNLFIFSICKFYICKKRI